MPTLGLIGVAIQRTTKAKYLGVTLDTKLSWKYHIDDTIRKENGRLDILYPLINSRLKLLPRVGLSI